MAKKDFYQILGVAKDASKEVIKKAYRKIAKDHHPDKTKGDKVSEEIFKEAAEAYETLSDDVKKANYDKFGHQEPHGYNTGGANFRDFFSRHQAGVRKGQNMALTLKLTLEEIHTGTEKKYKYNRTEPCYECEGHGGTDMRDCVSCNGSGVKVHVIHTTLGVIEQESMCKECSGVGQTYTTKCERCKGAGITDLEEEAIIDIPAGIENGMIFSLEGKGHAVKGGETGDLIIRVLEVPHKVFTRFGRDLKMNLTLTYPELVLGEKAVIETIDGSKIRISVPPYSQVGGILRVPDKGTYLYLDKSRGDLIITLSVSIPKHLNPETKELIEKLKPLLATSESK